MLYLSEKKSFSLLWADNDSALLIPSETQNLDFLKDCTGKDQFYNTGIGVLLRRDLEEVSCPSSFSGDDVSHVSGWTETFAV
jgi:hypothetical protein